MKKLIRLSTIVSLLLMAQLSFAQMEIVGTWKARCPLEKTSAASAERCPLCFAVKIDQSSIEINGFEMSFDPKQVTLNFDGEISTVPYTWNSELWALSFKFKNRDYKFNLLIGSGGNVRVLKDGDGRILLLERL
jgi:hypothetical protein